MVRALCSARARLLGAGTGGLLVVVASLASLALSSTPAAVVAATSVAGLASPRAGRALDVSRIDRFLAEQVDRHHLS